MTYGAPRADGDTRQTMCQNYTEDGTPCGSGSSDCPAWEVLENGEIRLTSSHDHDRTGPYLDFKAHEWGQVFDKVRAGELPKFLTDAIAADEEVCRLRAIELAAMHARRDPEFDTQAAQEYAELTGTLLDPVTGPRPVARV